ncbi:hypothetical protein HJ01_00328 [Flavobacterium frigoris PS1]|uniref:Uncharacterized protein n=2 Tax=Flavobacterium frigoris TaxID=229204 RepID=H7FMM1_FLAFP|nr:hypothetical protein HJ01_00328 [Flavobacterium frigoris PS1]
MQSEQKYFISLQEWKKAAIPFVIEGKEHLFFEKIKDESLKEKALKILNGELCFFSSDWKTLGANYDWITNPETNYKYDVSKHWSEINDFNPANGDIKYVWEKSRFSYLLTIIRNDYHFEEDHSQFVFSEIESWIDANPINQGPNWKCSQEISLRLFNWMYVLNFYKNSDALTEERWNKIQNTIYWSLHHVYYHINFSRIAVRNNHAITETLALTLSELLFPFIPESKKWAKKGRKWLEQEVAYQVYEDGTFLQFSMNYHRVVIQLFSFGISLTETYKKPFSKLLYQRAYASLNFLYQCQQEENGYLPNYGANDGALFFPLTNTGYRDYRSQLNTLHHILTKEKLFDDVVINEEYCWVQNKANPKYSFKPLTKSFGVLSFENGGYYICRTNESFTFVRCGNHKDRPSHADNLHVDVWVKGQNILRDSGTYKYNTSKDFSDYFTGTKAHNTVVVNNQSQMLKGSRFIWYYWTQCLGATWEEKNDDYIFHGTIKAFQQLSNSATHSRTIKISKYKAKWTVIDEVLSLDQYAKEQIWHVDDFSVAFESQSNNKKVEPRNSLSYDSEYYGLKKEGKSLSFAFKSQITTTITIKD